MAAVLDSPKAEKAQNQKSPKKKKADEALCKGTQVPEGVKWQYNENETKKTTTTTRHARWRHRRRTQPKHSPTAGPAV